MVNKELITKYIISAYNFQYYQRGCNLFEVIEKEKPDIETFLAWKHGSENIDWSTFDEIEKDIIKNYNNGTWEWSETLADFYMNEY